MESEIDLRPYIIAPLRRWRLLLVFTIALAALSGGLGLLRRSSPSASADVLIVPVTSQVTLDPRFQTTNGNQATTPAAQRQALISLASSHAIADRVAQALSNGQGASQGGVGKATVTASSDLLRITISNPDPDRALVLAKAWGEAYEELVSEVYTRSDFRSDLLDSAITAAQEHYDAAQQELETFVSDGEIIAVDNQIQQLTGIIESSREAQQLLYADYLTRTHELDLILADAQTLRDQVGAQSIQSFAENFTALLLRARTVDNEALVVQISASDLSADQSAAGSSQADLEQLITVLTRRREQMLAQANNLAQAITNDSTTSTGLDEATRQRYIDQLASLSSSYEQLLGRQNLLTQQRDVALDTVILLQKKRAEQTIARSAPQIEVRFMSASLNPQPSLVGRAAISAIVGGTVGLVLGILLAILLDVVIPSLRRLTTAEASRTGTRNPPTDQPSPGD